MTADPIGAVGPAPDAVCKCGRGPHATRADMCAGGHPLVGTPGPALLTGERSVVRWKAQSDAVRTIADAVVQDAGHAPPDAPQTLQAAASGLAQALLIRDSAFERISEAGGPLTSAGRGRRAFVVWLAASQRVSELVRLLGVRRVPKPAPSLQDYLNGLPDAVDEPDAPATDATGITSSRPSDAGAEGVHE
jgi:hypothetical protein